MSKQENVFQAKLICDLQEMYPEAIITKLDANHIQGITDIIILNNDKWATLECKKSEDAEHQPNQDYYVNKMNKMSFSSFIFPENRQEVLDALQQSFGA